MGFRLHINGEWSAAEFAALYNALSQLNDYFLAPRIPEWEIDRVFAYARRPGYFDRRYDLRVEWIKFASPGFTDLAGLGAVIKEVREFLQFLINKILEREDRHLSRQRQRLEIAKLKRERLNELASMSDHADIPSGVEHLLGLKKVNTPDIDPIIRGVLEGRITGLGDVATDDCPKS